MLFLWPWSASGIFAFICVFGLCGHGQSPTRSTSTNYCWALYILPILHIYSSPGRSRINLLLLVSWPFVCLITHLGWLNFSPAFWFPPKMQSYHKEAFKVITRLNHSSKIFKDSFKDIKTRKGKRKMRQKQPFTKSSFIMTESCRLLHN